MDATPAKPIRARKVDITHTSCGRVTRVTYAGVVDMSDGTHRDCGHENHPTMGHVRRCVQKLVNRLNRELQEGSES